MPSNSVLERRFERLIWRFRLVRIVPVLLSLMGSVGCFLVGAREILQALNELLFHTSVQAHETALEKSVAQIVGGVDYFVIGIALLIFGYGIYELVISDIDPRHEGELEQHRNLLSVGSLESLTQPHQRDSGGLDRLSVQENDWLPGGKYHRDADPLCLCRPPGAECVVNCEKPQRHTAIRAKNSHTQDETQKKT